MLAWWGVFDLPNLSTVERMVLLFLIKSADFEDGRNAFPKVSSIARGTVLGERTVHRALRALVAHGYVVVQVPPGVVRRSTTYQVVAERLERIVPSRETATAADTATVAVSVAAKSATAAGRRLPQRQGLSTRSRSTSPETRRAARVDFSREGMLVMKTCACGEVREGHIADGVDVYPPCPKCHDGEEWYEQCARLHGLRCNGQYGHSVQLRIDRARAKAAIVSG